MAYGNFHEKLWKNFLTHFVSQFLTNQGKNEDEEEQNWENEFDPWTFHIKIRLYGNFHENLGKTWNGKEVL